MATVALITTENAESRRIRELPPEVHVVELREFLGQGVPRSAFVDWIIPQVIAQKRVRTVHALFNSTIAYDVVERWGRELDAICNIFVDACRSMEDESARRSSSCGRPDFLAPVRAVLVDSQHLRTRRWQNSDTPRKSLRYNAASLTCRSHLPASAPIRALTRFEYCGPTVRFMKRLDIRGYRGRESSSKARVSPPYGRARHGRC